MLVAASVRTGDPPTDAALLAEIANDPATAHVRPGPLSEEAVGRLVARRLGAEPDRAFREACHRTTGGNPLLVRQLLNALETDAVKPDAAHADVVRAIGSRAVSSSVLLRLARLPGEAAAVARAVAVLGEGADLPAVAGVSGLDEAQVAGAMAALARAEILRPEPPPGFVHPLVRDAVYHGLPLGERELLHARAAGVLRRLGAPLDQVAGQLMLTPRRGDADVAERPAGGGHGGDEPRRRRQLGRLPAARARGAAAARGPAAAAAGPRRGGGADARARRRAAPARGLRRPDRRPRPHPRRPRARARAAVHLLARRRRRGRARGRGLVAARARRRGARPGGLRAHGRALRRARPQRDGGRAPVPPPAADDARRADDGRRRRARVGLERRPRRRGGRRRAARAGRRAAHRPRSQPADARGALADDLRRPRRGAARSSTWR